MDRMEVLKIRREARSVFSKRKTKMPKLQDARGNMASLRKSSPSTSIFKEG